MAKINIFNLIIEVDEIEFCNPFSQFDIPREMKII
jgi:hypothetical protein